MQIHILYILIPAITIGFILGSIWGYIRIKEDTKQCNMNLTFVHYFLGMFGFGLYGVVMGLLYTVCAQITVPLTAVAVVVSPYLYVMYKLDQ